MAPNGSLQFAGWRLLSRETRMHRTPVMVRFVLAHPSSGRPQRREGLRENLGQCFDRNPRGQREPGWVRLCCLEPLVKDHQWQSQTHAWRPRDHPVFPSTQEVRQHETLALDGLRFDAFSRILPWCCRKHHPSQRSEHRGVARGSTTGHHQCTTSSTHRAVSMKNKSEAKKETAVLWRCVVLWCEVVVVVVVAVDVVTGLCRRVLLVWHVFILVSVPIGCWSCRQGKRRSKWHEWCERHCNKTTSGNVP